MMNVDVLLLFCFFFHPKELMSTRHKGQSLLNAVLSKAGKVLPNTSPAGSEAIQSETEEKKANYAQLLQDMSSGKHNLESCLQDWCNYEASVDKFERWMKEGEKMVDGAVDPKATLPEKKMQLERCKVTSV